MLMTACTLQRTARVRSGHAAAWALGFWPEWPQVSWIKRDVAYVDYHSAHPHRMAEHGWPGITQRGWARRPGPAQAEQRRWRRPATPPPTVAPPTV